LQQKLLAAMPHKYIYATVDVNHTGVKWMRNGKIGMLLNTIKTCLILVPNKVFREKLKQ
jgi:hypothetical protein